MPGVPNLPNPQQDPQPPALRSKMCVDELDFSVPPPSLHSNVRPPSLFSPAPPAGLPGPHRGQFGASGLPGVQPLPMKPDTIPGPYLGPGPSTSLVSGLAGMSLASSQDWPQPQESLNTYSQPSRLLGQGSQAQPGHNPLLELISSVERPTSLTSPGQASSPFTQSYSLFSPSAWPGPLLSSPGSQQPPRGQPEVTGNMFGAGAGGPSPLERLLHQVTSVGI